MVEFEVALETILSNTTLLDTEKVELNNALNMRDAAPEAGTKPHLYFLI